MSIVKPVAIVKPVDPVEPVATVKPVDAVKPVNAVVYEPVELDYGEAARFFSEVELMASYSEIESILTLSLAFLEFVWSSWKVWTSF